MANNRMFLKCKGCGEYYVLAKYYPSTMWHTRREDNESFNEWLGKHTYCGMEHTEDNFELEYEHPTKL